MPAGAEAGSGARRGTDGAEHRGSTAGRTAYGVEPGASGAGRRGAAGDARAAEARGTYAHGASGGWWFGGAAFGLALQLGCVAYAARHVSPAALGAYAVALTAVHLLAHLAGTGIAASLRRAEPLTRHTAHAALRLAGITGFVGFAVAQLTAPLPALLLHAPDTTSLLRLLACAFLCHPAADAAVTALHRAGRTRAAVLADTGGQAGGAGTGILLLAAGAGPLGLAAMLPVAAALTLGAAALLLSRTPLPDGPPVPAVALLRISWFAAGFGLLRLLAAGAPLWAACRLLGPGAAGVYSRAAVLCEVPVVVYGRVAGGGGKLGTYPGLGRDLRLDAGQGRGSARDMVHSREPGVGREAGRGPETSRVREPRRGPETSRGPEPGPVTATGRRPEPMGRLAPGHRPWPGHATGRVRRVDGPAARLALTGASAAAFAGFGAAAGAGPAALAVLLGPGWESATALVPWLCAAAALQLVYSAGCSLDLARGRRRELLGTHLVVLLTTAAALALVLPWRGSGHALPLLACAAAAGPAAGHALQLARWGRCGLVRVREVLRAHAVHCGIGAAAGALAATAGSTAAEPGPALLYGLLALAPVAVVCAALHERLPLSAALTDHRPPRPPAPRPRTSARPPAPRRAPRAPVP
ncbi:oligosaccharide flippase family protein [Streptomyces sp. 184]|uniref:oligosaccharide flippase family protein n=1 Tax=Streptomyces sp. 184 TaxID=1827526 RepID=UPI003891D432